MEFSEAYLEMHQEMFNHALRLTRDRSRAQDIVQDAMIRAMKAWDRFEPGEDVRASVRAWMFKIVTNVFATDYQQVKLRHRVASQHGREVTQSTYGNAQFIAVQSATQAFQHVNMVSYQPVEAAIESSMHDVVHDALGTLDKSQRETVERYYFAGETSNQIAAAMCVPLATVATRLHRARKALGPMLRDYAKSQWGLVVDAGQDTTLLKPAKVKKTDANCVNRIVTEDDIGALNITETTPDTCATGRRQRVA